MVPKETKTKQRENMPQKYIQNDNKKRKKQSKETNNVVINVLTESFVMKS